MNFWRRSSSAVRCTCSMHGEKQQIFPSIIDNNLHRFKARLVWLIAAQGFGTSRNNASAWSSTPFKAKPSETTSRQVDVIWVRLRSSKNFLVIYARCWLNSKVYKWPSWLIVSAMAHDNEPDPVPASITTDPGTRPSLNTMAELSIAYKIWVFLARV